jgi:hypothetical protein
MLSDGNVSPLRAYSAAADAGLANAQLIGQVHFHAANRFPLSRKCSCAAIFRLEAAALSLPFVDFSL